MRYLILAGVLAVVVGCGDVRQPEGVTPVVQAAAPASSSNVEAEARLREADARVAAAQSALDAATRDVQRSADVLASFRISNVRMTTEPGESVSLVSLFPAPYTYACAHIYMNVFSSYTHRVENQTHRLTDRR